MYHVIRVRPITNQNGSVKTKDNVLPQTTAKQLTEAIQSVYINRVLGLFQVPSLLFFKPTSYYLFKLRYMV